MRYPFRETRWKLIIAGIMILALVLVAGILIGVHIMK